MDSSITSVEAYIRKTNDENTIESSLLVIQCYLEESCSFLFNASHQEDDRNQIKKHWNEIAMKLSQKPELAQIN